MSVNPFQATFSAPPPDISRFLLGAGRALFAAGMVFGLVVAFDLEKTADYRHVSLSVSVLSIILSVVSALFFLLSFISKYFREHIYQYLIGLIYFIGSLSVHRLYVSGFDVEYSFGIILSSLVSCLFFFDRISLL